MSQMIPRLTHAMAVIEGGDPRPVTSVKIVEIESGDWGVGGQALTTKTAKGRAGGKPAVAKG